MGDMADALTEAGEDAYVACLNGQCEGLCQVCDPMGNSMNYNAGYYAKNKAKIAARRKKARKDPKVREKLNAIARRTYWESGRPAHPARASYDEAVTVSTLEPLGRVILPGGHRTNVYSVAQLAELLGKFPDRIPAWEKAGVIPKPLWTQKQMGQWFIGGKPRLYTTEEMKVYETCRELLKLPFTLERSVFSTTVHEKIAALRAKRP